MAISTGSVINGIATPGGNSFATSSSQSGVLFDHTSTSVDSRVIQVAPGRSVIITAYGFREDTPYGHKFDVYAVATGTASMPSGVANCSTSGSNSVVPQAELYRAPVRTNGSPWSISKDDTTQILAVPGDYRLVMSSIDMLQEGFVVVAVDVPMIQGLPGGYYFGTWG